MTNAKQLMKQSALFAGADDTLIERFLARAQPVQFSAGEIPLAETTVTDRIVMVVEGELRVSVELQGPDTELKFLQAPPGTFLGLVNFFGAVSQPCTVTALTDVRGIEWKAEDWRKLAETDPVFGCQLAQRIGRELVERMSVWINSLLNAVSWGV